ncbi:MAG: type III pantothenate kinase [Clostridia bacterium]|nr:type III pantothenate kinase [Clostridia bacterium]
MLMAVDIGNTNITLGVFADLDSNDLMFTARLSTQLHHTTDQYAADIGTICGFHGLDTGDIDCAIISSVVPLLTSSIKNALSLVFGVDAIIVEPGVKTGLNILIDDPAQTGADLVAVSVAAKELYPYPNVVCDLGTASTITVLDKNGNMIGGVIYPGVRTSLEALVSKTSLLQLVSLDAPKKVIGSNTIECMQSGVIFGAASLLDGMIDRIESELGQPVTAIATGGLSTSVTAHCKRSFETCENLILIGLRLIYVKNR